MPDRRFWILFLAVAAFSFAGCGQDEDGGAEPADKPPADTPPADAPPADEPHDDPKPEPAPSGPVAIGEQVPDLAATDVDGKPFQLSKLAITKADAEASVMALAKTWGAPDDATLDTAIAALANVQEDGELDTMMKGEFVAKAGSFYGLQANEESAADLETLSDVVDWIVAAGDAPVVLMCWSPNCPTSKKLNESINAKLAASKARLFAVACNYRDTEEHYQAFIDGLGFHTRIIPDREQQMTDVLGGKRTPHFFVLDADRKLRFRGSLDNDPNEMMEDDERENWLLDAIAAVRAGKAVPKAETPGPG